MKYNTIKIELNEQEKKDLLKKIIMIDSKSLKKIYDVYKIAYDENFKIYKVYNGFNKDFYNYNLSNKFVMMFTKEKDYKNNYKDLLLYKDNGLYFNTKESSLMRAVSFSNYMESRNIDKLRQNINNVFYVFDGVVSSKREERRKTKDFYINNSDKIEARKQKARRIRKDKKQKEFNALDKISLKNEIENHKNIVISSLYMNINFEDVDFMQDLFSYCVNDNLYYFMRLYNKIVKMDYNNIETFFNDLKTFKSMSAYSIHDVTLKHVIASKIWSNNNHEGHISDYAKSLIINDDFYICNNKKYDKVTFKEVKENENI